MNTTQKSSGGLDVRVAPGPYGCPVVLVDGDIDFSNREVFAQMVDGAQRLGGPLLFLDLRGLKFIDSAGLHVIAMTQRMRRPGTMLIVRPGEPILRTFEIAGLAEQLTFIDCLPGEARAPARSVGG